MTKTNTFDAQSGKFLSAIASCMPDVPSETMQSWIESPGKLKAGLKQLFIRGFKIDFKIFESLVGRFETQSYSEFIEAMTVKGKRVLLPRGLRVTSIYLPTDENIEYVLLDAEALGIPGVNATFSIFNQADLMGLRLCRGQEIFYLLREKFESFVDIDGKVVFATKPIRGGQGQPHLLTLEGDLLSFVSGSIPNVLWAPETLWLFVRKE